MNILINLAPLKAGGGQNVGLNLLSGLDTLLDKELSFFFYVSKDSVIAKKVRENYPTRMIEGPHNTVKRVIFEKTVLERYLKNNKIDIIYSCFGYAFVNRNYKQVCGMAESNIMFPEIDFWQEYTGINRVKKNIIDIYRKWGYQRADALIFENQAMYSRTKRIFGKNKKSIYIKPSISVTKEEGTFSINKTYQDSIVGLFLCGWQLNKNIMMIPEIIKEVNLLGRHIEIIFTVSDSDENQIANEFKEKIMSTGVSDSIHFVGSVNKNNLSALYKCIDYVFLLSRLESFSNNIIEAWYYEKPLIISDQEWAHGICGKAAVYVKRDNAHDIASKIIATDQGKIRDTVVSYGKEEYSKYPSIEKRTEAEIDYVKEIAAIS